MEHPGIRLKKLREAKGLTDEQLVKKLYPNIKNPVSHLLFLRAWERGRDVHLYNDILIRLAEFFNVNITYLLGL